MVKRLLEGGACVAGVRLSGARWAGMGMVVWVRRGSGTAAHLQLGIL